MAHRRQGRSELIPPGVQPHVLGDGCFVIQGRTDANFLSGGPFSPPHQQLSLQSCIIYATPANRSLTSHLPLTPSAQSCDRHDGARPQVRQLRFPYCFTYEPERTPRQHDGPAKCTGAPTAAHAGAGRLHRSPRHADNGKYKSTTTRCNGDHPRSC